MARRTVTVTHFRYWKKRVRRDDKAQDLSKLPDGRDFLQYVYGLWKGLPDDRLMDRSKKRYREPVGCIPRGRTVMFEARVGTYGDRASLREADTKQEVVSHNGEMANTVRVRTWLAVPRAGKSALMFIEHAVEGAVGRSMIDILKAAWARDYPEWTLHVEALTRAEAWLATAKLEEVSAQIYDYSADLADAGQPKNLGTLKSTIVPKRGSSSLPLGLLGALADKSLSKAGLLGLSEEPDEIKVTLGDGTQSKTFVLGSDKTPTVRYLVTDWGTHTQSDKEFRKWCGAEAPDLFRRVGASWDSGSLKGRWNAEALGTRVVVESVAEDGHTSAGQ